MAEKEKLFICDKCSDDNKLVPVYVRTQISGEFIIHRVICPVCNAPPQEEEKE